MQLTGRIYAHCLLQLLTVCFLALYLFFTYDQHSMNYVWSAVALLLGVFGYLRAIKEVLLASLVVVCLYGCVVVYRLYFAAAASDVVWNDIIWMFVFPFIAIIGNINGKEALTQQKKLIQKLSEYEVDHVAAIDETMGFIDHADFPGKLAASLIVRSKRNYELTLMLVQLRSFDEFLREVGFEQSQIFLHQLAQLIQYVLPDAEAKAYLGEGMFAIIQSGPGQMSLKTAKSELDNKFNSMILTRPRRERTMMLSLQYGTAVSPLEGTEPGAILEKAKQELTR